MRYTEEQYVESASIQARIIDELNTELKALKKVNETQAEQLILHGVSQRSELLQKIESVKNFEWGINPVDNENRMCELIKLL